jgi:hypothetical protein
VLAREARLSHETVRKIIERETARVARVREQLASGPVGTSIDAIERSEGHHRKLARTVEYLDD